MSGTERPNVLSIELPYADRTQSGHAVEARWSSDGSRILVARGVDPRPWPLLDAARPDLGAVLALGGAVVIVAGTARVLRRPRHVGRVYCRRCNHDLNIAPGERPSSPRCPECGLALTPRTCVTGASRGGRLARVAIPAIVAMALGVSIFLESIGHVPAPIGAAGGPAWPVAGASAIGNWPWWRRTTVEQPAHFKRRVDSVRIGADGLRLEGSALLAGAASWVPGPSGAVIAWPEHAVETGWAPRVSWFDVSLGRGGSANLDEPHVGFPSVCGWSPDGREAIALLQRTGMEFHQRNARDDGTMVVDIDVFAIDTASGVVRLVDSGEGRATGSAATSWVVGPAIAAIGADPTARTVILVGEQSGGIALRNLCIIGNAGMRVVPVTGEVVQDAWGFRSAWITADGRLGVEFSSMFIADGWGGGGPRRLIDLDTGLVSTPSSATAGPEGTADGPEGAFLDPGAPRTGGRISPDGTRTARLEIDWSTPERVSRIRVVVDQAEEPDADAGTRADSVDAADRAPAP